MKKSFFYIACVATMLMSLASCCGDKGGDSADGEKKTGKKAAVDQYKDIYKGDYDKQQTFIVISKKDLKLTVYAPVKGDTLPVAQFPVCLIMRSASF